MVVEEKYLRRDEHLLIASPSVEYFYHFFIDYSSFLALLNCGRMSVRQKRFNLFVHDSAVCLAMYIDHQFKG